MVIFLCSFLFILCFIHGHSTKNKGLINLFCLFAHDHSTNVCSLLSFILSFLHDHSTKNCGPHSFISIIWTQPFAQNIWSSTALIFCPLYSSQYCSYILSALFMSTWSSSWISIVFNAYQALWHDYQVNQITTEQTYLAFTCSKPTIKTLE